MRKTLVLAWVTLLSVTAMLAAQSVSAQDGPPPSAGTLLVEGLQNTIGAGIGPDGALYVAEAGSGGDIEVTPPEDFPPDEPLPTFGLSGRVLRIDPETGATTTAGEGIGSLGFGEEGAGGAVDVAFIGDTMYVLTTGSADEFGQEDWPNGIYEVDGDQVELVADISAFNDANPVDFPDAGPGGNPFALDVRGNEFFVTDGNFNRILRATTGGAISLLAQFENVVPTGLEAGESGAILMTQFGPFPHTPQNSLLVSIGVPSGSVTQVAGGQFAQMIDVENGPGANQYVLQFGDPSDDPEGPPAAPFSGKILTLEGGTLSPLVTGFMLPTSLDFSGDTAYVTTLLGEVWQIENFSTVQPPPAPTAVPPTIAPAATPTRVGVVAPDTGTGPSDSSANVVLVIALGLGVLGLASGGAALAFKRR